MSYCHIKMIQIFSDEFSASYKILSGDFNKLHKEEILGILKYNKKTKIYNHTNKELWLTYKIYPIEIMELEPDERIKIVSEKYSDFASGSWALKILDFINTDLRNNNFPNEKTIIA